MRIALLIPFTGARKGWVWQDTQEQDIGPEYKTRDEAIASKPGGYRHLNDAWKAI